MVFGIGKVTRKIKSLLSTSKQLVLKSLSLLFLTSLLLTLSSVLYILIYQVVIPEISMNQSLNFLFDRNCGSKRCYYPNAIININEDTFAFNFKRGEEYEVLVDLVIPETPRNFDVGMFVISVSFESIKEELIWDHRVEEKVIFKEAKKSTMLRYKSTLVKTLYSLFYAPFLVPGIWEEAQTLSTIIISDFEIVPEMPLEAIRVSLESVDLDIYEANLTIQAKLKGYRYFMYHYPFASFLLGVPLLFPVIVLILSAKVYCVSYSKQKKLLSSSIGKLNKDVKAKLESWEESEEMKKEIEDVEIDNDSESTPKHSVNSDSSENNEISSETVENLPKSSLIERSLEIESLSLSSVSDEFSHIDDDDEGSIEVLMTPDTPNNSSSSKTHSDTEDSKNIEEEGNAKAFIQKISVQEGGNLEELSRMTE